MADQKVWGAGGIDDISGRWLVRIRGVDLKAVQLDG
jgi:hypothetical protein